MRTLLAAAALLAFVPGLAQASVFDEVQAALFDAEGNKLKPEFRKCATDGSCTAVKSLCRWRPVNTASKKRVEDVSNQVTLECKWPPPLPNPPVARCLKGLCEIPPDGKFY